MEIKTLQYYRSKLDKHDQAIYDALFRHWMHFEPQFLIRQPHCPVAELIEAVHLDNPILFYIDFYEVHYSISVLGLTIRGGYLYTKEEAKRYLEDCRRWGESVMAKLPRIGLKEQALWLHDLILCNVSYGSVNGIRAHNLVGVVADGLAVCEGISMAYKYLCDLADIPCIVVTGMLDQTHHAWNMLWIGGGTSFVDVTNDMQSGSAFLRTHFLRRSSEMAGYTWDQARIPVCKVYNADHPHLTAHSRKEFFDTVSGNISAGDLTVHLAFQRPLCETQMQELIAECTRRCPQMMMRDVRFYLGTQSVQILKISR